MTAGHSLCSKHAFWSFGNLESAWLQLAFRFRCQRIFPRPRIDRLNTAAQRKSFDASFVDCNELFIDLWRWHLAIDSNSTFSGSLIHREAPTKIFDSEFFEWDKILNPNLTRRCLPEHRSHCGCFDDLRQDINAQRSHNKLSMIIKAADSCQNRCANLDLGFENSTKPIENPTNGVASSLKQSRGQTKDLADNVCKP